MTGYVEHQSGLLIPTPPPKPAPIGVDLFAGCGGFSLGMEYGGIDVAVAVEWEADAALTYGMNLGKPGGRFIVGEECRAQWERAVKANKKCHAAQDHPRMPAVDDPAYYGWNQPNIARGRDPEEGQSEFVQELNGSRLTGPGCRAVMVADVTKLSGADILAAGGLAPGSVDVVFGGPPCQGFSTAGKQDPADPRSNMILEFLRLVIELDVPMACMENVPPLINNPKFLPLWSEWQRRAVDAGYDIAASVLDAANYGVPQRRRRAIVVLNHRRRIARPFQFPMPTNYAFTNHDGEVTQIGGPGEDDEDGTDALEPDVESAQGNLF